MTAADFMEAAPEGASLDENATVADMVRTYHNLSPNKPLPVVDSEGALVGVTSVGKAETLLQGTWPSTPVRALTTPVVELQSVSASAWRATGWQGASIPKSSGRLRKRVANSVCRKPSARQRRGPAEARGARGTRGTGWGGRGGWGDLARSCRLPLCWR
jgi:hypothetical protein